MQNFKRFSNTDINTFYESGEYQAICMGDLDDEVHFNLEYKVMSLYFIDIFNRMGTSPADINIIEIGCGSGGILLALKEWGANSVRGYDIDSHRVNYGKNCISEIEVGDALALDPEVYKKYNFILLSNVLEHLSSPVDFLNALASQIEPNNIKIIIDVPNLEYSYAYSNISFQKFMHIGHLWYFNSINIQRLLNHCGIEIDYIFPREGAFTIVCSKREHPISNFNNSYWNSISAINYANYIHNANNIGNIAKNKLANL